MRIEFTTRTGKRHSYEIDALHIMDCYGNEYYMDDSTEAEADETQTILKYDHKIREDLYPVWLPYEKQQNYYKSTCRDQKIDEILGE